MGSLIALWFVSVVLFFCGVVLLFVSKNDIGRKSGFAMLIVGLILFTVCWLYYPHAKDNYNYFQRNETSTP